MSLYITFHKKSSNFKQTLIVTLVSVVEIVFKCKAKVFCSVVRARTYSHRVFCSAILVYCVRAYNFTYRHFPRPERWISTSIGKNTLGGGWPW